VGTHQAKYMRYVWELPVRWCHWVNVTCIVVLAATGLLIGHPFSLGSSTASFTMGWIRFIHFTAAFCFTISVVSRVIWAFIGNDYSRWKAFFPLFSARGRTRVVRMLRYYLLIDKEVPETIGHNPLAATVYLLLFSAYFAMILTGLSLYAEYAPHGILHKALGFMYAFFTNQGMRLTHHITMWFIFGFVVNHVYSAWLMDIKEHGGGISSMFSGYKFTVHEEKD
jgi:Ni/Fe-hydrogenase 1 B-type cytochrome subunit